MKTYRVTIDELEVEAQTHEEAAEIIDAMLRVPGVISYVVGLVTKSENGTSVTNRRTVSLEERISRS